MRLLLEYSFDSLAKREVGDQTYSKAEVRSKMKTKTLEHDYQSLLKSRGAHRLNEQLMIRQVQWSRYSKISDFHSDDDTATDVCK